MFRSESSPTGPTGTTRPCSARPCDAAKPRSAACRTVTVNLDRGYDSAKTRPRCSTSSGFTAEIARKGVPAPIQAGKRWVVERTHSWMNGYGKLRRCTEKNGSVVDFYLYLAAALVTLRMLIRRAPSRYRWDGRPTTRRLK